MEKNANNISCSGKYVILKDYIHMYNSISTHSNNGFAEVSKERGKHTLEQASLSIISDWKGTKGGE